MERVLRDHRLMRTCSYEWIRRCDGDTTFQWSGESWSPQYFSGWRSETSTLVSGPFVDGGKYQLVKI